MRIIIFLFSLLIFVFCTNENTNQTKSYVKVSTKKLNIPTKICEIPLPAGFERTKTDTGSFASFLRNFPLKKENVIFYFDGRKKMNQSANYAVLDIDIGNLDLQQCADALMRLRAEYFFSSKQYGKIHFNFLSDHKARYYKNYAGKDRTYRLFRKYMNYVFTYANTASLHDEMKKVEIQNMQIGDVFIQKRRPYGHAVIVVDMAENKNNDEKIFMIAQSFMPAQSIHILRNFNDTALSPWYGLDFGEKLYTPDWTFCSDDLRRF